MIEKTIFLKLTDESLRQIIAEGIQQFFSKNSINKDFLPANEEIWLSRAEAADYLQISLPTLDKHTNQGKIPVHRVGRLKRYKKIEVSDAVSKLRIKYR